MSNMLRITGMATGMDTEATIKQLMKPYTMKVDKMKQEKQTMQWKQEIMRDMIKELRELKNGYLNIDSPDGTNMVKSGSFSVANITSSSENALTATAMPGASNVPTYVSIEKVAKPARISLNLKESGKEVSLSTKMSELGFKNGEKLTLQYGEKDAFTVTVGENDNLQSFINNFNTSKLNETGESLYGKIQINFSELTGSLNIETRNTGVGESLKLSATSQTDLLQKFKVDGTVIKGENSLVRITPQGQVPVTPEGKINYVEIDKPGNDFIIDNIRYSINPNYIIEGSTKNITLTSKADAQKSVDKIKGFVDKYNAIVDKIYSKYSEKKQYKFNPLSEEQKKEMKEDDIKKWETNAKVGLVKGDEAIGTMLNAMRNAIFTPVAGAGISLKEVGLDSYSGMESTTKPGQIKIDTNKLKVALETKGDQVMKLFAASPDLTMTKPEEINAHTGVFKRLNDVLNNYVVKFDGPLLKKAGIEGTLSDIKNDFTTKIKSKDIVISQMEKKMAIQEERYYKKFAQLEKAMNMMNSQSSWLTSQLGGGK